MTMAWEPIISLARRVRIPAIAILASLVAAFFCGTRFTYRPLSIVYEPPRGAWHFAGDFFLAVGAAIFIAVFISESVERSSKLRLALERERLEEHTKGLTKSTVGSVAGIVWGLDHSAEVSEEIIATNLSSQLLRENYLHRLVFRRVDKVPQAVRVSHLLEYVVFNPSFSDALFEPKLSFDDTTALYPNNPEFQPPLLSSVSIGEEVIAGDELSLLNERLYSWRGGGRLTGEPALIGIYRLPGKSRLRVRLTYESTELVNSYWTTRVFVPTKGIRVVVRNEMGSNFKIFVRSMFREKFEDIELISPDGAEWQRRYEGVVLPHSGWVYMWSDSSSHGSV
jgi:hypothetical protein